MNGVYGTKKPAMITSNDVDIFYYYTPSRSTNQPDFSNFRMLDRSLLSNMLGESNDDENVGNTRLPGMYNLRLPLNTFGEKGIYTIYIKPREIYTTILDVSVLTAYPDIRGIVLNANINNTGAFNNGDLVGYRVEYLDDNGNRTDEFRIITSNNRCEPLMKAITSSNQKGITYRFNNSSNLMFCTLTPSTAMSFKSDSLPNIGQTNQRIVLTNTKFNPVMLEVEMVDHDMETMATMLEGDQIRNLDLGVISTFNSEGGLYHQAQTGRLTDSDLSLNHDFRLNNTTSVNSDEVDRYNDIKESI